MLPFDNLGGDEATGRLADGITEDIITDLARFRDLDVIARNSTGVYKGKPVDVRQVGKDLNVGYVLEGSIQRQGDSVRVTGQLIDASTGAHVWSERWDRPAEDIFAVQTEVAEKVAAALGGDLTMGQITRAELQRAKRLRPNDLTAYDYFQLGKESKATVSNIDQGIEYLTKAVALDPQLARAYSVRAWLHNFSIMFGADAATALKQMFADAEKAVALDPQDCESLGDARVRADVPGPLGGGGEAVPLRRRDVPGQLAHPDPGGVRILVHWQGGGRGRLRRPCAAARSADDARQPERCARRVLHGAAL